MLHITWMQGNRVDSWLLVVGSQIVNLIPGPSFGHNLCFKCPNGSCERILDIYVSINFQWYKKLLNPLGFDPCNHSLNIRESIGTSICNVGVLLGVWGSIPSHSLALPGACGLIPELPSWPATLQALTLVASPRLGLRHWNCYGAYLSTAYIDHTYDPLHIVWWNNPIVGIQMAFFYYGKLYIIHKTCKLTSLRSMVTQEIGHNLCKRWKHNAFKLCYN